MAGGFIAMAAILPLNLADFVGPSWPSAFERSNLVLCDSNSVFEAQVELGDGLLELVYAGATNSGAAARAMC